MTKFAATTLFAGAAASAFFGRAAPAQAAPAGPGNAKNTIEPLDQSSIITVRYDNNDRVAYVTVR